MIAADQALLTVTHHIMRVKAVQFAAVLVISASTQKHTHLSQLAQLAVCPVAAEDAALDEQPPEGNHPAKCGEANCSHALCDSTFLQCCWWRHLGGGDRYQAWV